MFLTVGFYWLFSTLVRPAHFPSLLKPQGCGLFDNGWSFWRVRIAIVEFFLSFLQKLLPEGYDHLVCTYEDIGDGQFKTKIKLRVTTEDEVHKWLKDFQTSSLVTWRKSKTYPQHTGFHNAYRVSLSKAMAARFMFSVFLFKAVDNIIQTPVTTYESNRLEWHPISPWVGEH